MPAFVMSAAFLSAALMLGALGCGCSERGGGSGLGMEGIMAFGALGGTVGLRALSGAAPVAAAAGSVLAACFFGMLLSLLMTAAVRMGAERKLAGLGISLLGTAAAAAAAEGLNRAADSGTPSAEAGYAVLRRVFVTEAAGLEVDMLAVLALLLFAAGCLILYRTRFGACLRACGDQSRTAAGAGVSAAGVRLTGMLISGFLGGLGGLMRVLENDAAWNAGAGAAGFGFLSMAVMILGKDKPLLLAAAAVVTGLLCVPETAGGIPFLRNAGLSGPVYCMIPFVFVMACLALAGRYRRAR